MVARIRLGLAALLVVAGCHAHRDEADDTDAIDTVVVDTVVVDTDTDVVDTDTDVAHTDVVDTDPPSGACDDAGDCTIAVSCCDCLPLPVGDEAPRCDVPECFADACTANGLGGAGATCSAGRCTFDLSCDTSTIQCRRLTPECPPGQVPSVVDHCWGACVPVAACADVTDCGVCAAAGKLCVTEQLRAPARHHCVDAPAGCTTCACLGPSVCLPPAGLCADDAPGEISCSCPTCR